MFENYYNINFLKNDYLGHKNLFYLKPESRFRPSIYFNVLYLILLNTKL